jgi:hypothetical protein
VDLDGDGKLEILSGSLPGEIYCFHRKANGAYGPGEVLKDTTGKPINVGRASAVAVADWNGDGKPDLIIGNIDGGVFLVLNEGTAQKPAWGRAQPLKANGRDIVAEGSRAGPFVADWDGDGKLDLILGSGSGKVVWFRNTGSAQKPQLTLAGTLVEAASGKQMNPDDIPKRSGQTTKVWVADWNGDGRPDLIVGDDNNYGKSFRGFVWVYLRKGP